MYLLPCFCDICYNGSMSESLNSVASKRVIFPEGKQKEFLLEIKTALKVSWSDFSSIIKISQRTLTDWKNEKRPISLLVLEKMCGLAKIKIPENIKTKEPFWWTVKAGKIAGRKVYKKYGIVGGNLENRKAKWREWYEKTGKESLPKNFHRKIFNTPNKNESLSELIGIILGDGGINKRQVTITLNKEDDKDYSRFVANLIEKVLKIKPSVYERKDAFVINIVVSSTNLVDFLISMGIKTGNKVKNQVDVPLWIKKDTGFKKCCLRGLMDTDGCIFNECHRINKKTYCYPRLSFVNHSKPLLLFAMETTKELGFSPKIRNNRSVNLEKREDIEKYFSTVGTSNKKHLDRFIKFGGIG